MFNFSQENETKTRFFELGVKGKLYREFKQANEESFRKEIRKTLCTFNLSAFIYGNSYPGGFD